jgi:bifunctional DNA-binding transcriptional regulator/antitoxin component of YhaV-PrlF toxin-antitoxin module
MAEIPNFRFSGENMSTLQVRRKGTFTIPSSFRKKYGVDEGEIYTFIDLGDGSFLAKRKVSQVDILANRIARQLKEDNVSLEDLLETLDEERRKLFKEKYGDIGGDRPT